MITVLGSANIDMISYNDRLPVPGETTHGHKFAVLPGGKGANQAAGAARLGAKTVFLGKIGKEDKYADILWDGLKWAGVDTSKIDVESGVYCGIALIMVGKDGQNLISVIPGANGLINKDYLEKNMDTIISSRILLTEFTVPLETSERATIIASEAGVTTIVNPAPVFPMSDEFYNATDIITVNEIEAETLSGTNVVNVESAQKAAYFFHSKNVLNVVITMGSKGVFVSDTERKEFFPGIKVSVVDTIGAGDAFNGGLAFALWKGHDLFSAARIANATGAMSVTKPGALRAMPDMQMVEDLLRRQENNEL